MLKWQNLEVDSCFTNLNMLREVSSLSARHLLGAFLAADLPVYAFAGGWEHLAAELVCYSAGQATRASIASERRPPPRAWRLSVQAPHAQN
jgi:hypothetical protein